MLNEGGIKDYFPSPSLEEEGEASSKKSIIPVPFGRR